jgi:hypothetical protein
MGGAILLVSALIFGALAGGVVIQRLHANPAASSEQQQTGETGGNGQPKAQTNESNNGQDDAQNENESQDKDA